MEQPVLGMCNMEQSMAFLVRMEQGGLILEHRGLEHQQLGTWQPQTQGFMWTLYHRYSYNFISSVNNWHEPRRWSWSAANVVILISFLLFYFFSINTVSHGTAAGIKNLNNAYLGLVSLFSLPPAQRCKLLNSVESIIIFTNFSEIFIWAGYAK